MISPSNVKLPHWYGQWVNDFYWGLFKLMKREALRKHSLYDKTAILVLLKLFISSYE